MTDQPNFAGVRQFLSEAFSDEEIAALCFDYFPEVQNEFAVGMTKGHVMNCTRMFSLNIRGVM